MIRSMTGFGRAENNDGLRNIIVEIKSVNHRYNDIIVKMPKYINYLEENIKKMVRQKVTRGRVEVYILIEYAEGTDMEVKANLPLAKSYKNALEEICTELNIEGKIDLALITKFPDILKAERKEDDEDEIWNCLKKAISISLEELTNMREDEGNLLSDDIKQKATRIKSMLELISKRSSNIVLEHKEKLWKRIDDLLENKYEIDENKLANEVAYFADKIGIDEELVRLQSHINQLTSILDNEDTVGRKLDFLAQEMNREANTIGSKVGDVEITNYVVEIKTELEKIREQIQNIE